MSAKQDETWRRPRQARRQYAKPRLVAFQKLREVTTQQVAVCNTTVGNCDNTTYGPGTD